MAPLHDVVNGSSPWNAIRKRAAIADLSGAFFASYGSQRVFAKLSIDAHEEKTSLHACFLRSIRISGTKLEQILVDW